VPIAFAMGIAGSLGIFLMGGTPTVLYTLGTYPVSRCATFVLAVIPLFIFMGNLALAGGVAAGAYSVANKWLGRFKGGLVMVTIGACSLMGGTTGSTVAEAAAMGKIAIPEMVKYGVEKRLAVGTVACSGALAILIPPSISFVIYGVVTYQSIGKLFMAGLIPGIISAVIYMFVVYLRCSINPKLAPRSETIYSWRDRLLSLADAWGIILLFIIVIGGLYTGIATATEVGALGCIAALAMTLVAIARNRSDWVSLWNALLDTGKMCAMVFAFIIGAGLFSLFITLTGVIPLLINFIMNLPVSRLVILISICVFYLPLGTFFDPMAMILVTVPVFYPILVQGLGYDPIWFGVILVVLIEISVITPPMAINLYVIRGVVPKEMGITIGDIFYGSFWFLIMELVLIAILIAFPELATWLPSKMG
jgi:C4-dicarboxylate transporter DctM subunit